jgi:hypothetical protein
MAFRVETRPPGFRGWMHAASHETLSAAERDAATIRAVFRLSGPVARNTQVRVTEVQHAPR